MYAVCSTQQNATGDFWHGFSAIWASAHEMAGGSENEKVDLSYFYLIQKLFRSCGLIFFTSLLSGFIIDSAVFQIALRYRAQVATDSYIASCIANAII